jgi:hypothetical protein
MSSMSFIDTMEKIKPENKIIKIIGKFPVESDHIIRNGKTAYKMLPNMLSENRNLFKRIGGTEYKNEIMLKAIIITKLTKLIK